MRKLLFFLLLAIVTLNFIACDAKYSITDSAEAKNLIIFDSIIKKSLDNNWQSLPIGELIGKIAYEFIGTPYVGGTLEGDGAEICRLNLSGLDCVTLFENSLCLARIIKKGNLSYEDFIKELTFTRYRGGKIEDYSSRLHYTSEWILDNASKGVIQDISQKLEGIVLPVNVGFMTEHPQFYKPLQENKNLINKMKSIEKLINTQEYFFITKDKIRSIEFRLKTGDIICFATNKEGLDYSHTGLIYVDENGKLHLLHASSKEKKVILDKTLHEYIKGKKSDIGVTVLRPIDF